MVLFALYYTLAVSSPLPSDTAPEGKTTDVDSQAAVIQTPNVNAGAAPAGDLDTANTFILGYGGFGGWGGGYYGGYPGYGGYYGGGRGW